MHRIPLIMAGLAVTALPAAARAQDYGPYAAGQHHGWMWDGGWGGFFLGPLMMILVIGAVIFLVALAVRWVASSGHGHQPPAGTTPLDILKERFARGEIDETEFEQRRRVLGK